MPQIYGTQPQQQGLSHLTGSVFNTPAGKIGKIILGVLSGGAAGGVMAGVSNNPNSPAGKAAGMYGSYQGISNTFGGGSNPNEGTGLATDPNSLQDQNYLGDYNYSGDQQQNYDLSGQQGNGYSMDTMGRMMNQNKYGYPGYKGGY